MSAEMTFDTAAFERGLAAYVDTVERRSADAVRDVGEQAAKEAKANAPAGRSGRLRDSIKSEVKRDVTGFYAEVSVGPFYASFIEWGTRHDPARPFFRPALESVTPDVPREMKRRL